jgi:tetratricopeptide (TPR) repeat protein
VRAGPSQGQPAIAYWRRLMFTAELFMRLILLCCVLLVLANGFPSYAQIRDPGLPGRSGGKALYGEVTVEGEQLNNNKPIKVDLTLYTEARNIVERNTVSSNSRYRFNNIPPGLYELVAEVEGQEVARLRVDLRSPLVDDVKQDVLLAWNSNGPKSIRSDSVSAADQYKRSSANAALLTKAESAMDAKTYDKAEKFLQDIVKNDPKDFPVWTQLGNVHLLMNKPADAENEYLHAIDLHKDYFQALLNLGRTELALKNYDYAVDVLDRSVKLRPTSPDANYLLGEAYLQLKKGSLAVGFLNEALRLDPKGMVEVHLRLALLYNNAGMKDKAAAEYEAFLKQRPDYEDRKKLEDYISANKKP